LGIDLRFGLRTRLRGLARRARGWADKAIDRIGQPAREALASKALAPTTAKRQLDEHSWNLGRESRRKQAEGWFSDSVPLTLFLSPEAGLTPFYATHSVIARVLADAGEPVLFLTCNGLLPMCTFKMATRAPVVAPGDTSSRACVTCRKVALETSASYGQSDITMDSLLDDSDRAVIDALPSDPEALSNFVYETIDFGSAALGETLRDRRKTEFSMLTEEEHKLLSGIVSASVITYLALKQLLARSNVKRIVYFGDYAYYIAPLLIARQYKIPLSLLAHGYNQDLDRRLVSIRPSMAGAHMQSLVSEWPHYALKPLTSPHVDSILDGSLFRLVGHGGISTFSPNFDVAKQDVLSELGLSPDRKTLVAFNSSDDEVVCGKYFHKTLSMSPPNIELPFVDQDAWLRALIDWIGRFPDRQLIIRLHPRIASNHRFGGDSEQVLRLKKSLASVPPNVVVVWPDMRISSYNLAETADVALVAWSSIGLELARLGVPTSGAFPQWSGFPTDGVLTFKSTPAEYFAALDDLITRPADTLEPIRNAFRWTYYTQWSHLVDMSDVVPTADYEAVPPYVTPRNADLVRQVLVDGADIVKLTMQNLAQGATAEAAEQAALRHAVCGMIMHFMTGRDQGRGVSVRVQQGAASTNVRGDTVTGEATLTLAAEPTVAFEWQGQVIERRSNLVHRLGRILLATD